MEQPPVVEADDMVWIDADTMREIDRVMVDEVGIVLVQMMENAGRSLADLVRSVWLPSSVTVLVGSGGNGGGGLVAARHLANAGVDVEVHLTSAPDRLSPTTAHQLGILQQMDLAVVDNPDLGADVIVDAMVGYSLVGELRDRARRTAAALAGAGTIVSLDVPSGTDASTGRVGVDAVTAAATMTLCAPKLGLRHAPTVGDLFVADISVPPAVVRSVARGAPPPFERGRVLRLRL